MKILLSLSLILFSFFGFSQQEGNSIYFPLEILVHPECGDSEDKVACLKNKIQKDLSSIITKGINQFGTEKDTIKASLFLDVAPTGLIKEKSSPPFISDSTIRKKLSNDLKLFHKNLPKFIVLNKKPESLNVSHRMFFDFLVKKSGDSLILNPIVIEKNAYNGGIIIEVPVFPGCTKSLNKNMRLCFNNKMQAHIAQNFRYPRKAQKKKIQGKVHIIFDINSNGSVENIRTRGPHEILENEAIRIVKLLPKMEAGRQNGKPIRTPFAIPITFRLR